MGLIALLLVGFIFLVMVIIAAIILMVVASKNTKKRKIAISAECAKIDQMQAAGKISQFEAEELKRAVGHIPVTSEKLVPDVHIKLVGYFHLAMAIIIAIPGMFATFFILLKFFGHTQYEHTFGGNVAALGFLPFIFVPIFLITFFCVLLIASIALLKLKNWGRYIIIVLALLELWNFPLGTALGLYSLWVLLIRDGAAEYFTGSEAKY